MKKIGTSHKTNLSIIITLILLFSAVSPLFHFSKLESLTKNEDQILICTASGYKYVSLSDYQNGDLPDDYNPQIKCPNCIVNTVFGDKALISPLPTEIPFSLLTKDHYSSDSERNIYIRENTRLHSRDPPHINERVVYIFPHNLNEIAAPLTGFAMTM